MKQATRAKCSVCQTWDVLEHITVRVYRKRSQVDFRYAVCKDDARVLYAFLEGGALSVQKGMYLPPSEPLVP